MNFFKLKSDTYCLNPILESLLIILICFLFFCDAAFCQSITGEKENQKKPRSKPVVVDADNVEYLDSGAMIKGSGNVKIDYDDVILEADNIEVDLKTNDARATGRVSVFYNKIKIVGDKLDYNFQSKKGKMFQGDDEGGNPVEVTHSDVRITAAQIDFNLESRQAVAPGDIKIERGNQFAGEKICCMILVRKAAVLRV